MKIAKNKFIILALVLLNLGACGDSKNDKYSYHFVHNNCDTKKHSFNTKQEMCEALLDNSLNNGCALSMRQDEYARKGCTP